MRNWAFLILIFSLMVNCVSVAFTQEVSELRGCCQYNLGDYQKVSGKKILKFDEAPELSILVKQGKIPSVKDRLPEEPVVVVPWEESGQYGGTWKRAWTGLSDSANPNKISAYVRLVRFNYNGTKLEPDLAKRWIMSKDGKSFTFYLRKGLKWSDGKPFTTDDIMFWYKSILLNKEVTPVIPEWLTVDGTPPIIEKIDTYTFKISFNKPYPLFPMRHAYYGDFIAPKHYLSQFHPDYVSPDRLIAMAKEKGFQNWYQLFGFVNNWLQNSELPVLYPWRATNSPSSPIFILERNPYYYKIDPNGKQLPYIDRVTFALVENTEMVVMKCISGEIDMQGRHLSPLNYPLLQESRVKGDYRVLKWTTGVGADPVLHINQNVKDPVLRSLFRDKRFRIALSLAINRDEINQICYYGLGRPRQASVISQSPYFRPQDEKPYAEYDPSKANKLLDELGLNKRDKDGFRLRPDGKTLTLTIEYCIFPAATTSDVLELIVKYWQSVGIKTALKYEERSLYTTRTQAGEHEIAVWNLDRCSQIIVDPRHFVPYALVAARWCPMYSVWYTSGGKSGEEPPKEVKQIIEIWEQVKSETNRDRRDKLFRRIFDIHREQLYMIGTVGELPQPFVVKNNFRNVPDGLVWDDLLQSPANAYPEQFFIKQK